MHTIEPYIKWLKFYSSVEDEKCPFFGREYNTDLYSKKIYNYFIHSEWDEFGSSTLYAKILFVEYDEQFAFIELIGEWNDCLYNDIMFLKRDVIDLLIHHGISQFFILCDNVFNFHSSDDSYYEEWWDDVKDENGSIFFINTRQHIWEEMESVQIQYYVNFGEDYNEIEWRNKPPKALYKALTEFHRNQTKQLR